MQHPVHHKVDAHGQQSDGTSGQQRSRCNLRGEGREVDELAEVFHHGAPVCQRRLNADTQEGQGSDGQENKAEAKAKFGQQRRIGVGQDLAFASALCS